MTTYNTSKNDTATNNGYKNDETQAEYDALNFDGLERRANYRLIAFREDMLQTLDKDDAAATIYEVIWRWQTEVRKAEVYKEINRRKRLGIVPMTQDEVENMMYAYMSYNDFVRETGGAVSYNTVIRTINRLVKAKVIFQKENHDPRFPDYEYSINKEVVRELLKSLPTMPFIAPKIPKRNRSTQMGIAESETENTEGSTQMGTAGIPKLVEGSTQMGTEVYPNGGTSHNYTHTTHITTNTEEDMDVDAIAQHPTLSLSPQEMIAALSQIGYTISLPSNPQQQEIAANDTESHSQPHQGSEQTPPTPVASGNHAPPFTDHVGNAPKQSHHVGTQDTSFLPAHPTKNSPTMPSPNNEPPTPTTSPLASSQRENEASSSNGTSKQAMSYSLDGHTTKVTQAEQHPLTTELFSETPTGNTPSRQKPVTPEMPPAEMKWCAEKLVQITECKRIVRGKVGAYFDEGLPGMGAKSQRQRQLEAAKKIIARGITEGQYLLAYDDCNNEWWNTNKGSVTVETMAANTPRKIMRAVELIESLESKSQTIAGARMAVRVISQQIPPASSSEIAQMTEEEANQLAYVAQSQVSACGSSIATQVVKSSKNPNAYIVQVTWPNNHKMPIISAKRWSEKFKDMESVLRNVQMRQEIAQ